MSTTKSGTSSKQPTSTGRERLSGDLIVMAALIGVSRALFGPAKPSVQPRAVPTGGEAARGKIGRNSRGYPARGWMDIAWRVLEGFQSDRVMLVAAGVTFYGLLAQFPAIAAVVSLYGLFTDATTITSHLGLLSGFLPAGALDVIGDQVKLLTAQGQGTLGVTFIGTLALSLWGANAATKAIFDALNIICKEREKRSFVQLTLRSLAFTLGGIVLVLIAIGGIIIVPVALKVLGFSEGSTASLLSLLRWPLLFVAILFALACLYRFGPSRERPQWRWVTWGSAIAGGIWIVGSLLLSWYVANFGTYNATYGSLGAIIGFLIWMWLSTIVVLTGAEINAEAEHQTAQDSTEGRRKPMGARGATMADEVGAARS
jgi:membrane protein